MAIELYTRRDIERVAYCAARNACTVKPGPAAIEAVKRIAGEAVDELDRELEQEDRHERAGQLVALLDPEGTNRALREWAESYVMLRPAMDPDGPHG